MVMVDVDMMVMLAALLAVDTKAMLAAKTTDNVAWDVVIVIMAMNDGFGGGHDSSELRGNTKADQPSMENRSGDGFPNYLQILRLRSQTFVNVSQI
jgi:hypothetical protein